MSPPLASAGSHFLSRQTFKEAVTSKRFALLWFLGLMAFTPGLTVLGLYKRFGMASGAVVAVSRLRGPNP